MPETILVTGGAGFVGSHLVDALIDRGHRVRVFDTLDPQVHGAGRRPPDYLNPKAEFLRGDLLDTAALQSALAGVDVIYHQAAAIGVGQSMYEVVKYVNLNSLGTANLLQLLVDGKQAGSLRVRKLIVASSMSIYGEGAYLCPEHGTVCPQLRGADQLARLDWEMHCPRCDAPVEPLPTDEDKPLFPTSIYAITKRDHEEMCLSIGRAYQIPTVALRYFNIYGTRQSVSNPYTGVAAIFSSRLLNGRPPLVYEDGNQRRDFVHVSDIVQANLLALDNPAADYQVFNVGTGRPTSVLDVAAALANALGVEPGVEILNKFREGDIRHCYADITRIRRALGYEPRVEFAAGIRGMIDWLRTQNAVDTVEAAQKELEQRGLTR
jgi:dTDP-L-rhamnose 4-epimerase